MTQSLSADLRGRVIAAIEEGLSIRKAARRFRIGIATADRCYRRYGRQVKRSPASRANRQARSSASKLDPHEGFILGLIDEIPDITLAEIAERLAAGHGVRAAPSTVSAQANAP